MNKRDIESVIGAVAPTIKRYFEEANAPLLRRLEQLEARQVQNGKDGAGISDAVIDREGVLILTLTDGRSLRPGVIAGKDGEPGKPGRDADPDDIAAMVSKEVETRLPEAVAAVPLQKGEPGEPGAPGRDAELDFDFIARTISDEVALKLPGAVKAIPVQKGDPGEQGEPGRDADPELVTQTIRDEIERKLPDAVAAIPLQKGDPGEPGAPGKDADMAEIERMIAKAVQSIERVKGDPGKDGVGVSGITIDRDGDLAFTLSDGSVKELGRVVGRDGTGFDDMEEVLSDDGRLIIRRYKRGAETKEFHHRVPVIIDRGVYGEGREYATGDAVTWGGSLWIAQAPTAQKPGQSDTWRLAVKRGRDGKDAAAPDPKVKAKKEAAT